MKYLHWQENQLMKKGLFLIVAGCIAGGLLYEFFAFNGELGSEGNNTMMLVLSCLAGVLVAFIASTLNRYLNQLFSWKSSLGLRMLAGILTISTVVFSVIWIGINLFSNLTAMAMVSFASHFSSLIKLAILIFSSTLLYQIVYFALYSYHVYTKLHVVEVQSQRKQIEYQLEALKSQLSPHFLFNNLNSISALAYADGNKAELFIRKMAALYNSILSEYRHQLVDLKVELKNVQTYAYLLHARFGPCFRLEIAVNKQLFTTKIPPLSLQLLLENAIKHNFIDEDNPILISITNDADFLVVANKKSGHKSKVVSHQIGLKNIQNRYKLLTDKEVIIDNRESFTVKLPIIQ